MVTATQVDREHLTCAEWLERETRHQQRADALTAEHRERAARGEKHPVWDFLFTYYSYKPAVLRKWHPGAGVVLAEAPERTTWRYYSPVGDSGAMPSLDAFRAEKPALLDYTTRILSSPMNRTGQFGCFGMHEWAMVYRQGEHRHELPLRLGQSGTDDVVEAHDLKCTHFDAFRFFTPEAVPRNRELLTREGQVEREQPGCLHAGMDIYKWAIKLGPLVLGEVLLDAFVLARDIRLLDMQASPYDVRSLGYEPVEVETAAGKAEYVRQQRAFSERGNALRTRILEGLRPASS